MGYNCWCTIFKISQECLAIMVQMVNLDQLVKMDRLDLKGLQVYITKST